MQDVIVDPGLGMRSAADSPVSDSIEKMVSSLGVSNGRSCSLVAPNGPFPDPCTIPPLATV